MLNALISLVGIGSSLGLALGVASRVFYVEGDKMVEEVQGLLPSANCGQCGYAGCAAAAEAMVAGSAPVTCCTPGGAVVARAVAAHLGVALNTDGLPARPNFAVVSTERCIGCTKCLRLCQSDAIVGAAKQMHDVMAEACTGCGQCAAACPTGAIDLLEAPVTLGNWVMPRPALQS
ncbi:MAG: RnfABCDGE type electron transport complex subunit B [Rhodocyclaceae bacterium]